MIAVLVVAVVVVVVAVVVVVVVVVDLLSIMRFWTADLTSSRTLPSVLIDQFAWCDWNQ